MFVTLALLAAAATPQTEVVPAAPVVAAPEKKICRRPKTTGSRLPERPLCHTKAEWAEILQVNQNDLARRERDTMNTSGNNAGIDSGAFLSGPR